MWAVALVLVVVVVVAVVVTLVRRPRGDDVHSVRNYNQALGTLEHLSERIGPPVVRPTTRPTTSGGPTGTTSVVVPPVPVRGTDEFPDPDAPIVFDDARPLDRNRITTAGDSSPTARNDRAQRMALDSMNHRRRGGTGIIVGVAVVLVFGALALLGSHRTSSTSHPATTPTTLPTQFVAATTSSTGTSAEYAIPHVSFQITATGTGSCWVQVTSVATGKTVWAGALSAGTVQNIDASGATTVQFGTPTLALEVDTIPVVLPSPLRTPFVATFTPSPAAVAAAASTTLTSVPASGASTTTSTAAT
jgi:hypothetical protein